MIRTFHLLASISYQYRRGFRFRIQCLCKSSSYTANRAHRVWILRLLCALLLHFHQYEDTGQQCGGMLSSPEMLRRQTRGTGILNEAMQSIMVFHDEYFYVLCFRANRAYLLFIMWYFTASISMQAAVKNHNVLRWSNRGSLRLVCVAGMAQVRVDIPDCYDLLGLRVSRCGVCPRRKRIWCTVNTQS